MLPVLLLAAMLLLPSTSWSHGSSASTSSLTGTIKIFTGGIDVSVTNNGPDPTNWVWIRMVPSVHHTSASMDGGGCGPGGDSNTVRCGIAAPGFEVGSTHEIRIMTDAPYPPNGGAQLFTSQVFSGPLVPAGNATGPAPTTPPPTATTPKPKRCTCTSLTARILPRSVSLVDSGLVNEEGERLFDLRFSVRWVQKCSGGTTRYCSATVEPKAPGHRILRFYSEKHSDPDTPAVCSADCGTTRNGSARYTLGEGNLTRTTLANKTIHITIRRKCQGKALEPISLSIGFDRVGRVSLAKSKLG